jgi:glyoxylase-like metal-dependent hydrolase (beta-lactamase superfamily II)/8-oxo-dGTP pyrophosphatase MutT (NUDIX family)
VLRAAQVAFAGGFRAFPGGRLDPADARIPVAGAAGEAAALVACAIRELFEETGILLAGGAPLTDAERSEARRALLAGTPFAAIVARHRLELDAAALAPAGRWVTPDYLPIRYDARLFLASAPEDQEPEIWPGELVEGGFVCVKDALARWRSGEAILHPPNLWALQALARGRTAEEALALLRAPPYHDRHHVTRRVEFQEGVFLAALRTPTLAPATHTNAWLVDVGAGVAIVDPGSPWPDEQERLERRLDEHAAEGRPPKEIWLTHAHRDHVGGAAALATRYGIPIRAHPECAARVSPSVREAIVPVAGGELLAHRFRAHHTPGHARGHLAFHDERTGALFCGDLVSTISTVVVDPPEGDMGEYVQQLARIRTLAPLGALFPGHGPPHPDAAAALDAYLAHRRVREEKIAMALEGAPAPLCDITARAYDDTPAELHPVAARSCLATLEKLEREGRAARDGERWRAAADSLRGAS